MVSRLLKSLFRRVFTQSARHITRQARASSAATRLGLELLEARTVMAGAVSVNQAFIASAYQGLLGRPVDAAGLTYWSQKLNAGASLSTIVSGIEASDEARGVVLTQLYQSYLNRPLDGNGRTYWLGQLSGGASWETVEAGIAGSPEHFNLAGGYATSEVAGLFQTALNRSLDTGASQYFQNLANSGISHTNIAALVLTSPEARARVVTTDYQTILGRSPDAAGLAYWTGQLTAGVDRTTVLAGILGSTEYASELAASAANASDPNTAASTFLSSAHRFASAPQPPRLTIHAPDVTVSDPTVSITVRPGSGGMPQSVVVDLDLNADGVFSAANEVARYSAPVVNGVATVTLSQFPDGNHQLRARAADPSGAAGVSAPVVIRSLGNGDPINPNVPKQLAAQSAGDAAIRARITGHTTAPDMAADHAALADSTPTLRLAADTAVTEAEPNDTPALSNIVPVAANSNTVITGSISTITDVDYYKFTLVTKSGVFFEVNSRSIGLSTTLNSGLALLDSTGTTVIDTNDDGYNFDSGYPLQAAYATAASADSSLYEDLNAGTYYLAVVGVANTTGNYQLKITPNTNYSATPPALSSLPSAPATIYLDFGGHTSAGGDDWNGSGSPYTIAPYRFAGNAGLLTPGEQLAMQNIWKVVSEDYSPFNVNVTTVDPGAAAFADGKAIRVVFGGSQADLPNDMLGAGVIGVGIEDSFATNGPNDQLCFVFADDPYFQTADSSGTIEYIAEYLGDVASHEAGHTFGLHHYDVLPGNLPIMEYIGPDTRATWWKGMTLDESATGGLAPFLQDDMAVISNATNGFGYRPDANGSSIGTATPMSSTGLTYRASGVIDNPLNSHDFFSFQTGAGAVSILVNVDPYTNDLNAQVSLFDSTGTLIASSNNPATYTAQLALPLNAGTYVVEVSSKAANPGEAGLYTLTVDVPSLPPPPPDRYEANQTSDKATNFGTPVKGVINTYQNLTIGTTAQGLPDYDWYKYTIPANGNFYVTNTNSSRGPLETHLFKLVGGSLIEMASETNSGTLLMGVSAGQVVYVEVKGQNDSTGSQTQGTYTLDTSLN